MDIVVELSAEAGLLKMEEDAQAAAKAAGKSEKEFSSIYYTLYGESHPEEIREHLDSGVLTEMIANKEASILAMPTKEQELEFYFRDPCYIYVLLGACAMTLGCQLPESYIEMMKKVYREGGLMPDALKQMERALFGPDGYTNGVPMILSRKASSRQRVT